MFLLKSLCYNITKYIYFTLDFKKLFTKYVFFLDDTQPPPKRTRTAEHSNEG
jgi:hypothetical protein